MKNVVITVVLLAIVIFLVVAVILPITNKSKSTGQETLTQQKAIDTQIHQVVTPIN